MAPNRLMLTAQILVKIEHGGILRDDRVLLVASEYVLTSSQRRLSIESAGIVRKKSFRESGDPEEKRGRSGPPDQRTFGKDGRRLAASGTCVRSH
jgi:hypothetical protein